MKLLAKLCVVLVFLNLSATEAQVVNLNCLFTVINGIYTCSFVDVIITNDNVPVNIVRQHLPGRTDADVLRVEITSSNISSIFTEVFTLFSNMESFQVTTTTLNRVQSNAFANARNLRTALFIFNQMVEVQSNGFTGASNLLDLEIFSSQLELIHETAFNGLTSLQMLYLERNQLHQLSANVFRPLVQLEYLSLTENQLSSLDGRLLESNTRLSFLSLASNRINAIGRNFVDNLTSLRSFNTLGNICTSNFWAIDSSTTLDTVRQQLSTCFNNFVEPPKENVRRFALELRGSLTLLNEDGNEIVRL